MKTQLTVAATAILFLLVIVSYASYAVPAERNMTDELPALPAAASTEINIMKELSVSPSAVSSEQNLRKELSSPRYALSPKQKVAQEMAVITSFALIDYHQSVSMFYGSDGYSELNPALGQNPTRQEMATFGVVGLGAFYLLANNLSEPWRQIVVDSIIASERMNIEDNRRISQGWNTNGPPIRGRLFNGVPLVISLRF